MRPSVIAWELRGGRVKIAITIYMTVEINGVCSWETTFTALALGMQVGCRARRRKKMWQLWILRFTTSAAEKAEIFFLCKMHTDDDDNNIMMMLSPHPFVCRLCLLTPHENVNLLFGGWQKSSTCLLSLGARLRSLLAVLLRIRPRDTYGKKQNSMSSTRTSHERKRVC